MIQWMPSTVGAAVDQPPRRAAIQGLTGLPSVADFRDPWIGNAYAAQLPGPHRLVRSWLERRVVGSAAASVFPSAGVRDQ